MKQDNLTQHAKSPDPTLVKLGELLLGRTGSNVELQDIETNLVGYFRILLEISKTSPDSALPQDESVPTQVDSDATRHVQKKNTSFQMISDETMFQPCSS